ncbi:DUF6300 family protein [Streptomyces sp. NPDC051956]|uniref:DUF6300 family protein n=1 Tax=Streptomyces sp. NPDC051956 TaxID=3365677 RepID=UPI0037D2C200
MTTSAPKNASHPATTSASACGQSATCLDETLGINSIETFGGLVAVWVESVRHQRVDEALLAKKHEQWSGEL